MGEQIMQGWVSGGGFQTEEGPFAMCHVSINVVGMTPSNSNIHHSSARAQPYARTRGGRDFVVDAQRVGQQLLPQVRLLLLDELTRLWGKGGHMSGHQEANQGVEGLGTGMRSGGVGRGQAERCAAEQAQRSTGMQPCSATALLVACTALPRIHSAPPTREVHLTSQSGTRSPCSTDPSALLPSPCRCNRTQQTMGRQRLLVGWGSG